MAAGRQGAANDDREGEHCPSVSGPPQLGCGVRLTARGRQRGAPIFVASFGWTVESVSLQSALPSSGCWGRKTVGEQTKETRFKTIIRCVRTTGREGAFASPAAEPCSPALGFDPLAGSAAGRCYVGLSPRTELPGYVRRKPAEAGWVLASDALPGVSAFRIASTCYVFRQGSRLQAAICFPVAQRFDLRAEGRCRNLTCFRSPVAACDAAIWETVLVSTGVFNGRQRKRLLFVPSGVNAAAEQRRVRLCGSTGAEAVSCRLSFCWGFGFPAGAAGGVVRPFLAIILRRCWG